MHMRQESLLTYVSPARERKSGEGFESILIDLKASMIKPISLAALSDAVFTLGARQSWQFGYNSLSAQERKLYAAFSHETVLPIADDEALDEGHRLYVSVKDYGKPVIGLAPALQDGLILGYIPLDPARKARAEITVSLSQALAAAETKEANAVFARLQRVRASSQEIADDFIRIAKHGIDHIDPVLIYVHDQVFTNFGTHNNLLGKNSSPRAGMLLDDLMAGHEGELSSEARMFLVCFYYIKRAGLRGEEFNGQQLSLSALTAYLNKKITELASIAGAGPVELPSSLEGLADLCKALKLAVRKTHFTYRKINGLCFFKSEHHALRSTVNMTPTGLPRQLHEPVSRIFDIHPADHATVDDYFGALVAKVCGLHDLEGGIAMPYIEQLLELVVKSCMDEVGADIGMSRGFRDWRFLQTKLAEGNTKAITDASTQDYFCAVFLSDQTLKALGGMPGMATKVMKAIAQRMSFNSWHYMPGHFAGPNDDGDRHFYFPPRMSDTAVWSDQHHAGHVMARVRYSIRSPASLYIGGRKMPGIIDIRLMKSEGSPFTDSELMRVREYTAHIRALHQALANWCEQHQRHYRIDQFDKRSYE